MAKEEKPKRDVFMKQSDMPNDQCLSCGKKLDAVTGVGFDEAPEPEPGNATVCVYCSATLVFTDKLQLRRATAQEITDLRRDNPLYGQILRMVKGRIAARIARSN